MPSFKTLLYFLTFTVLSSPVWAADVIHDGEYYFVQQQYADQWAAAEDKEIDNKLAEIREINGGKIPVRLGTEIHYLVIRPDDEIGSDRNLRFYIIPAVPSAFIPILN